MSSFLIYNQNIFDQNTKKSYTFLIFIKTRNNLETTFKIEDLSIYDAIKDYDMKIIYIYFLNNINLKFFKKLNY